MRPRQFEDSAVSMIVRIDGVPAGKLRHGRRLIIRYHRHRTIDLQCGCPSCKRADSEIISIGKDAPERLFLYLHYRSESFNSWTNPDPQAGIDIEKLAPEAGQEKFNKQELYKMRERKIRSIRL